MLLLNSTECTIMESLAKYRFLTTSQLRVLTGGKSLPYVRQLLRSLKKDRQFVKSFRVTITSHVRAEDTFYLTQAGADLINSDKLLGLVTVPQSGKVQIVRDYHHRKASIDCFIHAHMHLEQHCIHVTEFVTYYDHVGSTKDNTLQSKAQLLLHDGRRVIPDGIFVIEKDSKTKLLLVEMFCDDSRNLQRVLQSIATHAKVLAQGVASKKYGVQDNAIVLCAFSHEKTLESIVNRLRENERFASLSPYFFFANLPDIKAGFGKAWRDIHDNPIVFV